MFAHECAALHLNEETLGAEELKAHSPALPNLPPKIRFLRTAGDGERPVAVETKLDTMADSPAVRRARPSRRSVCARHGVCLGARLGQALPTVDK